MIPSSALVKRVTDVLVAATVLAISLPVQASVAVIVRLTSPGPVLHWSTRVGRGNQPFEMAKFRTMRVDTPQLATHVLGDPSDWLTRPGRFLRRASLDELPQLWNVLRGDMSIVGPRPALFNQDDLIEMRTASGIDVLRPGITGLAQVMGRDDLAVPAKVELDRRYLEEQNLALDLELMIKTVAPVLLQRSVRTE